MNVNVVLLTDRIITSPNYEQLEKHSHSEPFTLIFSSSSQNATLTLIRQEGLGIAFYFSQHESITLEPYFQLQGSEPVWVSVKEIQTTNVVQYDDGQDIARVPELFFVDPNLFVPVVTDFCTNGQKSKAIRWAIEDAEIDRLGELGCFDHIE